MNCFILICIFPLFLNKCCHADAYTDKWAAHIEDGEDLAKSLAEKHGFIYLGEIFSDHYQFAHQHVAKRSAVPSVIHQGDLLQEPQVKWLQQQKVLRRVSRSHGNTEYLNFTDPEWPKMWYLNRGEGFDMNVQDAWLEGYTGKGVVVTVMDDGLERDHPDLQKNYDPEASFDVNDNDSDPLPRYDYTNENRHGTRCAGVIAAEANNDVCGTGVAFDASIGGIRMLDGDVTDAVEAQSMSYNPQHIDIYMSAWGPDDDGRTVEGPGHLMQKAIKDGIEKGRGGKGSIFLWSSGNGGRDSDWCNCDGYVTSIYTLSVSSVTENGHIPWYSEACPAILAVTYSSGMSRERQAITTDLRKGCTEHHTGTAVSTSLAAGISALTLSANPALTWRDLQHIVVRTARPENLNATDWVSNGAGMKVSHSFGFGLMDATAMVRLARKWTGVPEQHRCEIHPEGSQIPRVINGKVAISFHSDGCYGMENAMVYLEHVQVVITLSSSHRGQIQLYLTSPQGTKSTLLAKRPRDRSRNGFTNWAFMTTHSWGEMSTGTWTLDLQDDEGSATLQRWSLVLYGTSTDPLQGMGDHTTRMTETETNKNQATSHGVLGARVLVWVQISLLVFVLGRM